MLVTLLLTFLQHQHVLFVLIRVDSLYPSLVECDLLHDLTLLLFLCSPRLLL